MAAESELIYIFEYKPLPLKRRRRYRSYILKYDTLDLIDNNSKAL